VIGDWTCFTSFNRRLYDIIASEMLASWLYHWPQDARLVIYLEDAVPLPQDPRIEIRDWQTLCGPMWHAVDQVARDLPFWQSDHTQRYTKKGMTFIHMLEQQPGRVCWLDADILTKKSIPDDLLDRAHDPATAISLFNGSRPPVDGKGYLTAESGFVLINSEHDQFLPFLDSYRTYYTRARMPKHAYLFWDGEILIQAARDSGSWFDLRTQCRGKSSTPLHAHWLGEYMLHMKSKRKKHYDLETYRKFWRDGLDLATATTRFPWQK